MIRLAALRKQLKRRENLRREEIALAVEQLVDPQISPEEKAAFLMALSRKGETTEEIAGFAEDLRRKAEPVPIPISVRLRRILDVCGTGGDHSNTFNISTTVAILAAAGGITVAKHGNRAITSQSGSADVLEALGIKIDRPADEAADALAKQNFAFFMAPQYHKDFKVIAPARKICAQHGSRTIFNFLGPLLNPAQPNVQLIGVAGHQFVPRIARVLSKLNLHRGLVVCGQTNAGFLDELSILGYNSAIEVRGAKFRFALGAMLVSPRAALITIQDAFIGHLWSETTLQIDARKLDLKGQSLKDIQGGDKYTNAKIIRDVLSGKDRGPKRSAVVLNGAAAFYVYGKSRSIVEGVRYANAVIDSGAAMDKLKELSKS